MGFSYDAELHIRAVPRDRLVLQPVASPDRPGTTVLEIRCWARPWSVVEQDGRFYLQAAVEWFGPFSEEAAHEQADERNHRPLSEAWDRLVAEGVDWVDVDENADGTVDVTVVDGSASYGIAQWCENGPGLDELLMGAQLAFEMSDEGISGVPGQARWWRPGLTRVVCANYAPQTGIVIARGDLVAIMQADLADPAAIVAKLREQMDITDEELRPVGFEPIE